MEVVGLVASVITLIGAANLTSSTIQRAWGLRGSPPYLIDALNEVNDFKALLQFIRAALSDDSIEECVKSEIKRLLDRANEKLHAFDEYLKTKVLRDGVEFDSNANVKLRKSAKLREVIGEGQVQVNALQQELNSVKMNLMLAINISQLQRISRVPMSIQNITLVDQDALDVSIMSDTTTDSDSEYSPTQYLENITSSLMSPSSTAMARRHHPKNQQLTPRRPSYVSIETNILSNRCMKQCPCQCHVPMQGSTPQWLKGVIGTAFFRFVGTPLLNHRSCNFAKCENQSHGAGSTRFRYFFPTWLLPKGIEFAVSWGALGGIGGTWSLRLPRAFVGDITYILLQRLIEEGSVQEFRRAMADRGVRAIDVFPGRRYTSLMAMAIHCEREDICLMLLEAGADAGAEYVNGITLAQLFWQLYLLRSDFQLLRNHAAIAHARNDCNLGPVHQLCIDTERDELVRHIALDPGCVTSRDCYGFTPLHWAARSENVDAVDSLLHAGADVNAVCNAGRSVLSWSGSWTISKMLLDSGADIRIIDDGGDDAVFSAINSQSSIEVVELLLVASSGFDDQRQGIKGSTYLMEAMRVESIGICELALKYTADISAQDDYGFSALTYAIPHNFHAGLELLLDHGADPTQLDCDGNSIIVLVALFGDIETMRILKDRKIEGLPMEPSDIEIYWDWFRNSRNQYFLGQRAPVEEEEKAFQAFLDSIIPCDPKDRAPNHKPLHVPGAFSVSDDDDVELGNDSDTETDDYESCDEELVSHESDVHDIAKPQYEVVDKTAKQTGSTKEIRGGTVDTIV